MTRRIFFFVVGLISFGVVIPIIAQQSGDKETPVEKAINAKEYKKADSILKKEVASFLALKNFDTISFYIPFAGKIANELYGTQPSVVSVFAITDALKNSDATAASLLKAYRKSAEFFSTIGQNKAGFDASEQSLIYAKQLTANREDEIARCEYNIGVYAHRLGNVSLSLAHHREAMRIRTTNKNTPPEDIYLSANALGGLLWYASKYDSAAALFNQALDALKKMPENDINKFFRPGNIQNNLAAIYSAEGKTSEAIAAMQQTISNFQQFIQSKDPGDKKQSATEGLYEAIDNLAGIYKEIGDYGKAGQLLRYSYDQKKAKLDPAHSGIFISEILLGQHYHAIRENDTALYYLKNGLAKLEKDEGDYLFWAADAYYSLALIYEDRNDNQQAAAAFAKSEELYEASYQGQYDNLYMDFLRSAALFYAKSGNYPKAFEKADKVYKYLISIGEGGSLQAFYQLLNIAEINYMTHRYKEAISYCNNALQVVDNKLKEGRTLLDSVKMEVFRPKAVLINAKALYALQTQKDTAFLHDLAFKMQDALRTVEKRKALIDDETSINILISDNQELIEFAKKIELELAERTGNAMHIDQLINLHESGLYNRIRSRIDKQQASTISGIPTGVLQEEQQLKKALVNSLTADKSNEQLIDDYIKATQQWEAHLEKVKKEYPAYYNMRYASIVRSIPSLQASLPDSTVVLRYLYVDTSLLALVMDSKTKRLVRIEPASIENNIKILLNADRNDEKKQLTALFELYKSVWQPVEPLVRSKKVTIIPDAALYNLSFEMLTPRPIGSFKEMITGSLLARHTFSYHYSLFMLGNKETSETIKDNYVAFAPGFSDEVKRKYLDIAKDTVTLDEPYLRLLPQPATNKLARKMSSELAGDAFLDEASTKTSFEQNAAGHKIIHIGTHATYNNLRPEKSGLIFAKDAVTNTDSNFLSLVDVYGCDLRSNLTILTACESGKPGYKDGEGMISLAHAFNYSGSQHILTALWKIDEQASSLITESFIDYLRKGYATDEALQQAKLNYLQASEGRILAPAYWAGLVMIGEPMQISIEASSSYKWYIIGVVGLLMVLLGTFFIKRKMNRSKNERLA